MAEAQDTPAGVGAGTMALGTIDTELAVTVFQLSAGVFGGLAALVAARRLSQAGDEVPASTLVVPVAIAGASTVLGAFLLPTE